MSVRFLTRELFEKVRVNAVFFGISVFWPAIVVPSVVLVVKENKGSGGDIWGSRVCDPARLLERGFRAFGPK